MIFDNVAIKIKNFNDFNEVQRISFKRGCKWYFSDSNNQYIYGNHGRLDFGTVILIKNKTLYISTIQESKKNNINIIESSLYINNKGFIKIKKFKLLEL